MGGFYRGVGFCHGAGWLFLAGVGWLLFAAAGVWLTVRSIRLLLRA